MPAGERTEQATPKRRKDERNKGNVFKSREIILLAGMLGVFFTLQLTGEFMLVSLTDGIRQFWDQAGSTDSYTFADVRKTFIFSAILLAKCALPALLAASLIAAVFTLAQTRGLFSAKAFSPKFSRLNPLQGIKRVLSLRGLIELLKSLLKIVILGYVIYGKYMDHFGELPRLMETDFVTILTFGGSFMMEIVINVSVIFAFLAGADYLFQRWQYEKDLRMTKQEIKEEYKQTEGDPQIKAKIKDKQRQMSQARMMQNVPEADVIIRNPTHYAVALKYDADNNRSPVVIAKGADLMALRIIKKAEEHDIIIMENKPLARGIYETVPLDREIPEEFFHAVAEVLAFVYSKQKRDPATGKTKS